MTILDEMWGGHGLGGPTDSYALCCIYLSCNIMQNCNIMQQFATIQEKCFFEVFLRIRFLYYWVAISSPSAMCVPGNVLKIFLIVSTRFFYCTSEDSSLFRKREKHFEKYVMLRSESNF